MFERFMSAVKPPEGLQNWTEHIGQNTLNKTGDLQEAETLWNKSSRLDV